MLEIRCTRRVPWVAAVLNVLAASSGVAQATGDAERPRTDARVVSGVVQDTTGAPILHARIFITVNRSTVTGDSGTFRIADLPRKGDLILDVRRIGFQPQRVKLTSGGDTAITIRLGTVAATLDAVRVEAGSASRALAARGFYERQRDAERGALRAVFYTAEDVERRRPQRSTDVIAEAPGIRVVAVTESMEPAARPVTGAPLGARTGYVTRFPGRGVEIRGTGTRDHDSALSGCRATVYLDGARLNRADGRSTADLNDVLTPGAIAGIEVYSGGAGAPPQFPSQNGGCAVVVIWTKT